MYTDDKRIMGVLIRMSAGGFCWELGDYKLAVGHEAMKVLCGWLSKLWSLFGYPKYQGPYENRDPKRDHNFDNQPFRAKGFKGPSV